MRPYVRGSMVRSSWGGSRNAPVSNLKHRQEKRCAATHLFNLHAVGALQVTQASLHKRGQIFVHGLVADVLQAVVTTQQSHRNTTSLATAGAACRSHDLRTGPPWQQLTLRRLNSGSRRMSYRHPGGLRGAPTLRGQRSGPPGSAVLGNSRHVSRSRTQSKPPFMSQRQRLSSKESRSSMKASENRRHKASSSFSAVKATEAGKNRTTAHAGGGTGTRTLL